MTLATATLIDTWAGAVPAHVASFRTKRAGVSVVRYRWERKDGMSVGIWRAGGFPTVERAIQAAKAHPHFHHVTAGELPQSMYEAGKRAFREGTHARQWADHWSGLRRLPSAVYPDEWFHGYQDATDEARQGF